MNLLSVYEGARPPRAPMFNHEIYDWYLTKYDDGKIYDNVFIATTKIHGGYLYIEVARYENEAWIFIHDKYYNEQEFLRLVRMKAFL